MGVIETTCGDLFKGSQLEKQLIEFGAKAVTLLAVTPTTLLAIEKAEAIAERGLSFAGLSDVEAGHLERLLAGEIQWAMPKLFPAIWRHSRFVGADRICSQGKICTGKGEGESRTATPIELRRIIMGDTDFDFLCKGCLPMKPNGCERFWPKGATGMRMDFPFNW